MITHTALDTYVLQPEHRTIIWKSSSSYRYVATGQELRQEAKKVAKLNTAILHVNDIALRLC